MIFVDVKSDMNPVLCKCQILLDVKISRISIRI